MIKGAGNISLLVLVQKVTEIIWENCLQRKTHSIRTTLLPTSSLRLWLKLQRKTHAICDLNTRLWLKLHIEVPYAIFLYLYN